MRTNWFLTKEVAENIYGIAEFGHVEKVVSYLIMGDKKALLFDTGMGINDISNEAREITRLPILVLNSHTHFDHIGNNSMFKTVFLFNNSFSIQRAKKGYSRKELKNHVQKKYFTANPPAEFDRNNYRISPFSWKKKVGDGDVIDLDPFRLRIIHTPGHSPDSICLYESNLGYLFSGDSLYNGPIYLHLTESNPDDYRKSLEKLLNLKKTTKIMPGHNSFSFDVKLMRLAYQKLRSKSRKTNTIYISEGFSLLLNK